VFGEKIQVLYLIVFGEKVHSTIFLLKNRKQVIVPLEL